MADSTPFEPPVPLEAVELDAGQKVWSKCCKSAKEFDKEVIERWRTEIDTLLVFVSGDKNAVLM